MGVKGIIEGKKCGGCPVIPTVKAETETFGNKTFYGHPSCVAKWKYRQERIRADTYGRRITESDTEQPELPFTPEEDFDDLQVVIHESLAPTAISESARISELEGELQAVRSLNFGLREHNDELWKIIRALAP